METAVIVKVAVSAAPYSIDKPYDYLVPQEWLDTALPGARVTVPFGRGNRTSEGLILARAEGEKAPGLKPLAGTSAPCSRRRGRCCRRAFGSASGRFGG